MNIQTNERLFKYMKGTVPFRKKLFTKTFLILYYQDMLI